MSMETKRPGEGGHGPGEPGYETRDASIPSLAISAIALAVVLFVSFVGMKFALNYFQRTQPLGPPASPVANVPAPVGPQLQAHPHEDLVDYCKEQGQQLERYGWVDQKAGVVQIPVDRAMELILERGLPIRAASAASAGSSGVHQIGTVEAPLPQGAGGPCGYLYEAWKNTQKGEKEAPKD